VALECRLLDTRSFGASTVVFGEVVWAVVDEEVLRDERPEITLLKPVSRLGADEWGTAGSISSRRRVPFAELA
jgi:flavin reductase (DIM6/NTAB) family NADH-FMN oxidoreductase RutF